MKTIFTKGEIIDIDIGISDSNWENLLATAGDDIYVESTITIKGIEYSGVGIRAKGNSSLRDIDLNPNSDRFSFRLDAEEFNEGQRFDGLKFMVLNNGFSDLSYMKEYLSYYLFEQMGVKTPVYTFARVTKNNQPWGLYTAVEVIDDDFLERYYGHDNGNLYKPEIQEIMNGPTMTFNDLGSDLVYTDDNFSSYSGIFENIKTDETTIEDQQRIVNAIKNLSFGTNLETSFNIDGILRWLAVNTALVNMDSYAGIKHNYYIYEDNSPLEILPWDLNMSFGGFQMDSSSKVINFPIDAPYIDTVENTPLIAKILAVDSYKEQYHTYLQYLIDNFFTNDHLLGLITATDNLIQNDVSLDATALYTYSQYQEAINQLKIFVSDRAKSIQAQLDGEQPTNTYGTVSTSFNNAKLVNTPDRPRPPLQ